MRLECDTAAEVSTENLVGTVEPAALTPLRYRKVPDGLEQTVAQSTKAIAPQAHTLVARPDCSIIERF
jgi:hypothetical protein